MTGRSRLAAVVCLGSAVGAALGTSTAGATVIPDPTENAFEVQAVMTAYGETPAQATEDLQRGADASRLVAQIAAAIPDRYAGVWMTRDAGIVTVHVGIVRPTQNDVDLVRGVASQGVTIEAEAHSEAELFAAARRVGAVIGGPGRVVLDEANSQVTARLEPGQDQSALDFLLRSTPTLEVPVNIVRTHLDFTPASCTSMYVCGDGNLRGGLAINQGTLICTGGFSAYAGGTYYYYTAGHCFLPSLTHWTTQNSTGGNPTVGVEGSYYFAKPDGSTVDWGTIQVGAPSYWTPKPWIIVNTLNTTTLSNASYLIHSAGNPAIGARTCFTGRTSGTKCGTVSGLSAANNYETTGAPVLGGDSGGPVFSYNVAQGIVGGNGPNGSLYFTGIGTATAQSGIPLLLG